MPLYSLHNPGSPIELRFGALELMAFSVSAVSTYVMVPAFNACFDLGHCAIEAARLRNVFLTHTHQDHCGGTYRHLALRSLYGSSPSRIHVPTESREAMVAMIHAFERLEGKNPSALDDVVFGVDPGDSVRLSPRYRVQAFDVRHRLASRGYTVFETRRQLLPEHVGKSPEELWKTRERGERVEQVSERPVFTYVGDSTIETLHEHPELGESDVLFLEATHLPGTSAGVSRKWGHTHLSELVELWKTRPECLSNPHIVLKHFSTRYKRSEILRALDALPMDLRSRVTMLV